MSRLNAKVKAINRAHTYANQLSKQLQEIFRPLVGQEILKVDGQLLVKVKNLLPEFSNTSGLQVYRSSSNYSLAWTVKTSEMDTESTWMYYEIGVYVGSLNGKILTDLTPREELRVDYMPDEILRNREEYLRLKKLADTARSNLWPFGENDF